MPRSCFVLRHPAAFIFFFTPTLPPHPHHYFPRTFTSKLKLQFCRNVRFPKKTTKNKFTLSKPPSTPTSAKNKYQEKRKNQPNFVFRFNSYFVAYKETQTNRQEMHMCRREMKKIGEKSSCVGKQFTKSVRNRNVSESNAHVSERNRNVSERNEKKSAIMSDVSERNRH